MNKVRFNIYVLYDQQEGRYYWKGNKDDGVGDLEAATAFYSEVKAKRMRDKLNATRDWNFEVVMVRCTLEEKENKLMYGN